MSTNSNDDGKECSIKGRKLSLNGRNSSWQIIPQWTIWCSFFAVQCSRAWDVEKDWRNEKDKETIKGAKFEEVIKQYEFDMEILKSHVESA